MLEFFKNKRVLVTGHTGFKGAYLCRILTMAGAEVTGYALDPPTEPSLFDLASLREDMNSVTGDIRDFHRLLKTVRETRPEVVFHLAAQPIVRYSYEEPRLTFETNIMGTVNLLEAVRQTDSVRSFVNVTTDKVYLNNDSGRPFREDDPLNGFDPYSNSKSCSDLVTQSYRNSFFSDGRCAVSTARAGNVIGGCDFAKDRLIPDCVRAAAEGKTIGIRNPSSVRPFQHVFEPLSVYLALAVRQTEDPSLIGAYNVGPDKEDCLSAGEMADIFCREWNRVRGTRISWESGMKGGPREAALLVLDNTKVREKLGWRSLWNVRKALEKTVEMEAVRIDGGSVRKVLDKQIEEFLKA